MLEIDLKSSYVVILLLSHGFEIFNARTPTHVGSLKLSQGWHITCAGISSEIGDIPQYYSCAMLCVNKFDISNTVLTSTWYNRYTSMGTTGAAN